VRLIAPPDVLPVIGGAGSSGALMKLYHSVATAALLALPMLAQAQSQPDGGSSDKATLPPSAPAPADRAPGRPSQSPAAPPSSRNTASAASRSPTTSRWCKVRSRFRTRRLLPVRLGVERHCQRCGQHRRHEPVARRHRGGRHRLRHHRVPPCRHVGAGGLGDGKLL